MVKEDNNTYQKPRVSSSSLIQSLRNQKKPFTVETIKQWNPNFCGDIDMRIGKDGTWYYCNSPIGRKAIVKLFSSVLIKEKNKYFLVTPIEKVGITVDDVPFIAVDFETRNECGISYIIFITNIDDKVLLGKTNPIRFFFNERTEEPTPYVLVSEEIEARIDRKSFYRLIELGEYSKKDGVEYFGLWSDNVFFPIISKLELDKKSFEVNII